MPMTDADFANTRSTNTDVAVARLDERSTALEKAYGELRRDLRSTSNRVWALLVIVCVNLLSLLVRWTPTVKAAD